VITVAFKYNQLQPNSFKHAYIIHKPMSKAFKHAVQCSASSVTSRCRVHSLIVVYLLLTCLCGCYAATTAHQAKHSIDVSVMDVNDRRIRGDTFMIQSDSDVDISKQTMNRSVCIHKLHVIHQTSQYIVSGIVVLHTYVAMLWYI
jgi:hypothetical protein